MMRKVFGAERQIEKETDSGLSDIGNMLIR